MGGGGRICNFFSRDTKLTADIYFIPYCEVIQLVHSRGAFSVTGLHRSLWLVTYFMNFLQATVCQLSPAAEGGLLTLTRMGGGDRGSGKGVTHHKTHHHIF
jgi:hypothetical protein